MIFTRLNVAFLPLAAAAALGRQDLPADFECPKSIRATVPGGLRSSPDVRGGPSSVYGTMRGLHSIMLKCSDITEFDISITRTGGPDFPAPEDTPDRSSLPFDQAGGELFPSRLETLSLEAYDFGASEWEECRPPGMGRFPNHRGSPGDPAPGGPSDWSDWFTGGRASEWRRLRQLSDEQRVKRNLNLWIDAMDFSALRNLTVLDLLPDGSELLSSTLASRLPALKAVSVDRYWGLNFLRALPGASLSHLSLRFSSLASQNRLRGDPGCLTCRWRNGNFAAVADDGLPYGDECSCEEDAAEANEALGKIWLQHGGPQLEELEFRGGESASRESREVLNAPQLQAITASSPNLRKLTIDLDRDGGVWPDEELRVLATEFPALESLSLYVEMASSCARELAEASYYGTYSRHQAVLGMPGGQDDDGSSRCSGEDRFAQPLINESTVAELFALLRQLNVQTGTGKLVELYVKAGDWTQPWQGAMYGGKGWIGKRSAWARCWVETADGHEDKIQCDGHDTGIPGADEV